MINKTTIQTIKALVELAKLPQGEVVRAKNIARRIKFPQDYLAKVLQGLVGKGIVASKKGLNGGFFLARKPKEIRLYDVVIHTEGLGQLEGCVMGRKVCSNKNSCVAHKRWELVKKSHMDFLLNTTIADLKK